MLGRIQQTSFQQERIVKALIYEEHGADVLKFRDVPDPAPIAVMSLLRSLRRL